MKKIIFIIIFIFTVINSFSQFNLTIQRKLVTDKCIMGYLLIEDSVICYTLELPYKNNINDFSSIPKGSYYAKLRTEGKKGWRIELINVPNRDTIEIHVGNYTSNTRGCFLVGVKADIENCSVIDSRRALNRIEQSFVLFKQDLCLDCDSTNEYDIIVKVE